MKLEGLAVLVVAGCTAGTHPVAPATNPTATTSTTTECYAGLSTGMGQHTRTIARRTVDPVAKQIIEDVSHDDAGAHGAKSFHVVMSVDGDHFAMTEAGGAFTGTGTLVGEPWQWTSWTSISQIPDSPITVESHDEITPTGMKATKQIKQSGTVVATTTDELKSFDCAQWDEAKVALTTPAPDNTSCERACRNFATLKFWQHVDTEIAALPTGDQAAARARKQQEFTTMLDAGIGACIAQCLGANNAERIACMANATKADELGACDGK
jgi:hypothetical protein